MPLVDFHALKTQAPCVVLLERMGWRPTWKSGARARGPCPIHGSRYSKSRCFAVSEAGFFCHKCKANGDVVTLYKLLSHLEGVTNHAAALLLCGFLEIPIPYTLRWPAKKGNGEAER